METDVKDTNVILLALVLTGDGQAEWQFMQKMKVGDVVTAAQSLHGMVANQEVGPTKPVGLPSEIVEVEEG